MKALEDQLHVFTIPQTGEFCDFCTT